MRIIIETPVASNFLKIRENFNQKLFMYLNPPFPPVKLKRFDGCQKGDIVSLELNFIFFKQQWTSEITHDHTDEGGFTFVDKGIKLPFFLSFWEHTHKVLKADGNNSKIFDDINFFCHNQVLTLLMAPALYLQFLYRIPRYKKFFKEI
ncbi:MAG TPA: hypothetical protein ACFCUD_11415 [Cyclobacteriaceae bacterium]